MLWKANKKHEALIEFLEVLSGLNNIENIPENFSGYCLHKLIGNVLLYLSGTSDTSPPPGTCSDPDPNHNISKLSPTPIEMSWFNLYQSAIQINNKNVFLASAERIKNSSFSYLRYMVNKDEFKRRLIDNNLEQAFSLTIKIANDYDLFLKRQNIPLYEPDPPDLVPSPSEDIRHEFIILPLICAMGKIIESHQSLNKIIERWGELALINNKFENITISTLFNLSNLSTEELWLIIKNQHADRQERLLSSIVLFDHDNATCMEMLYTSIQFIISLNMSNEFIKISGKFFGSIVQCHWLRLVMNPYQFINPRLHIPAIISACNDNDIGWGSVARIILAAIPSQRISIPSQIINQLKAVAEQRM